MMIEFECSNFSGFDPGKGRYVECGHKLIVPEEKLGEMVTCPKCNQELEVPLVSNRKPSKPNAKKRAGSTDNKNRKRSSTERPGKTAGRGAQKRKKAAAPSDGEMRLSEPLKRPKSDLGGMLFEDSQSAPRALPKDERKRCEKCGSLVDKTERCTKCGHVKQKFEFASKPLDEIKVGLAGFQKWFCETMTEGMPMRVMEYGAHASAAFVLLFLVLVSIFAIGGVFGGLLVLLLVLLGATYVAFVVKGHQLANNPRATLAWFQKPVWLLVLIMARKMKWQNYDQRFQGRKIIDCRGEGVTDEKILDLEDIEKCEVLDLQNTPVTDNGLRTLYTLQNLHCLVLRKTQVTDEGVFRLQQTLPSLWIWY